MYSTWKVKIPLDSYLSLFGLKQQLTSNSSGDWGQDVWVLVRSLIWVADS